jgi:glycosyltransferase involved in cell wall biosynthesis
MIGRLEMELPPPAIDGVPVIAFAILDSRVRWTGRCRHFRNGESQPPAQALAICGGADSWHYLIGCSSDWQPLTETRHRTLEETKRQAEYEFAGVGGCWNELSDPPADPVPGPNRPARPQNVNEVVWSGHVYGYAGYAKMNREILLRLAGPKKVRLAAPPSGELGAVDAGTRCRLDAFRDVRVSDTATWVRGYTPRREWSNGKRVCFTMMETQVVHPDFIRALNRYDECWTPTRWNRETFESSGATLPIRVVPLGVDPEVFRPRLRAALPEAELLNTERRGLRERPEGFVFVTLYQPTFRKGLPVLLQAFARAFSNDPEAVLLLATTIHPCGEVERELAARGRGGRVYALRGVLPEEDLARLFSSCQAYVSASLGEGWNLPLCEAAACGIPVIAGRHSAHAELLSGETAFLFDHEGYASVPGSETVCPWYEGQPFARFGERSVRDLADLLRTAKSDRATAMGKAAKLGTLIRTRYSWDASAKVVRELLDH